MNWGTIILIFIFACIIISVEYNNYEYRKCKTMTEMMRIDSSICDLPNGKNRVYETYLEWSKERINKELNK